MDYSERYSEIIDLEGIDEATELAIRIVKKNGELDYRDKLSDFIRSEIEKYSGGTVDVSWVDGLSYVLKIVREVEFDDGPGE